MPDTMSITPYFSVRYRRRRYRLDVTLRNGDRFRRSFDKKSDAERVEVKLKSEDLSRRYGLPVPGDRPFLSDLITKRVDGMEGAERTRAARVLNDFAGLLPVGICVDEVNKALIQKYVEKS